MSMFGVCTEVFILLNLFCWKKKQQMQTPVSSLNSYGREPSCGSIYSFLRNEIEIGKIFQYSLTVSKFRLILVLHGLTLF